MNAASAAAFWRSSRATPLRMQTIFSTRPTAECTAQKEDHRRDYMPELYREE